MTVKFKAGLTSLLCACGMSLTSCAFRDPPQTRSYCVDIPPGQSSDASRYVQTIADHLRFKVAEEEFPSEKGPPHQVWEAYGRGVSMFVGTAMKDGKTDRFGNVETTFNPNRLELSAAKTGWWQRVPFEEVVATAKDAAHQRGWAFTKGNENYGCST